MPDSTKVTISQLDGVTVVGPKLPIDHLSTHNVSNLDDVLEAAERADPPLFVVDLSQTTFVSSSFLMFLVHAWRRLETRENARFALCGLSAHSAQIIAVTHLNEQWEIFDSAAEAVDALSSHSPSHGVKELHAAD